MLTEAVRGIFAAGLSPDDVADLIDQFLSRASRSRLPSFVRLSRTIRKHRHGILAAVRLNINNARHEALNNKVRLLTRRAYGFHSANAALALIMLTCRPITLMLPHQEIHLHVSQESPITLRDPLLLDHTTKFDTSPPRPLNNTDTPNDLIIREP